jgi:hypothetical protein
MAKLAVNVHYTPKAVRSLESKIEDIKGRGSRKFAQAVAEAVEEGNQYDRVNGRTKDGGPVARLRRRRRGVYQNYTGEPLAPKGAGSRVVTHFHAKVKRSGGKNIVVAGWKGVVSSKGVPFLAAHNEGQGNNTRRPIFGMSPRTRANLRVLLKDWAKGAFKKR